MWKRAAGVVRSVEVEVWVGWRGETLCLRRVRDGEAASMGDVPGALVPIPCDSAGVEGFELVRVERGEAVVRVPAQARARMERSDGTVEPLAGPRDVCLQDGDVVRMGIGGGAPREKAGTGRRLERFSIVVTGVRVEGRAWGPFPRRSGFGRQVGLSAAVHAVVLAVALVWPESEPAPSAESARSLDVSGVATILGAAAEPSENLDEIGPPPPESVSEPGAQGMPEAGAGLAIGERMGPEFVGTGSVAFWGPAEEMDAGLENAARASGGVERPAGSSWWLAAGGTCAAMGMSTSRWKRVFRLVRARRTQWSWAGAVRLVGAVGRPVERVGLLGFSDPDAAAARTSLDRELISEVNETSGGLDVVAVKWDATEPTSLKRAWDAVRTGGALVVGSASVTGEGVARSVAEATGAAVVWLFEKAGATTDGELRAVVLAVKGRPSKGPRAALEAALEAGNDGVDVAAIADGFRGSWPLEEPTDEATAVVFGG